MKRSAVLGVLLAIPLPACHHAPGEIRRLDLDQGRGITVFFILGFFDEYGKT